MLVRAMEEADLRVEGVKARVDSREALAAQEVKAGNSGGLEEWVSN